MQKKKISKTHIIIAIVVVLGFVGNIVYQNMTRISSTYDYFEDADFSMDCHHTTPTIVNEYEDYLEITESCNIEQDVEEKFFDDHVFVFLEYSTFSRRIRSVSTHRSLIGETTIIRFREGERTLLAPNEHRLYLFAYRKGTINEDDIEVRTHKERSSSND